MNYLQNRQRTLTKRQITSISMIEALHKFALLPASGNSLPTPSPPASKCMPRKLRQNHKDMSIHLLKIRNIMEKCEPLWQNQALVEEMR
jgi:hypothetical protein